MICYGKENQTHNVCWVVCKYIKSVKWGGGGMIRYETNRKGGIEIT